MRPGRGRDADGRDAIDARLAALDARTGAPCRDFGV
jgi:hypothetical protein